MWLLDDDSAPYRNALEEFVKADNVIGKRVDYGFLSGRVLWSDGRICRMNKPKFFITISRNNYYFLRVYQSTFVNMFLPARTVKRAGIPVSEYFIWGDDTEYTRRIALHLKMDSFYVRSSRAVHYMDNNNGGSIARDDLSRMYRYRISYRNDLLTYCKEGFFGILYFILKCLKNTAEVMFVSDTGKSERLKALWLGVSDGLKLRCKESRAV